MSTAKQIFLTDGTVGHVFAGFAVVTVKQDGINAHPTIVAMPEVFATTNAAKATVDTMVWTVGGAHPQVAHAAVIFAKARGALNTAISV
jgi:hypothetical protein